MTRRLHAAWLAVVLIALATGAAPAFAQEAAGAPPAPVAWSSLSPDQQRLLGRFGEQWNSLPPARQQALAHGSQRWLGMSSGERDQARERFSHWQSLPPEQRQALRQRWQHFQALSPAQRAQARENFHRFQALPPERRQMLRQQWHSATPQQRAQMVEHARAQRAAHGPAMHHPSLPHRR